MIIQIGQFLSQHGYTPTMAEEFNNNLSLRYPIRYASSKRNLLLRMLDMIYTIIRHSRRANIVIIHSFSSLAFYYTLFCALLCRLLGLPYITIIHGGNFPHRMKTNPRLCALVFNHSVINVCPSLFLMERLKPYGYKTSYIPNFININESPFKLREHFDLKLLWVRSFDAIYNPEMAIDVLAILKQRYPEKEIRLAMIGPDKDGSAQRTLDKAKAMGVDHLLEITGKLTKKEWKTKAADFDLFINTTNIDNNPVSVIETMGLGLPIVSTEVGGIPFLIAHGVNGFMVPANDPVAMANQLIAIIENPGLGMRVAETARREVEKLDWAVLKEKWFELFDRFKKIKQ